jgi:hypothetical protein
MGYYVNGNQVPTPVSPVDGYAYSYDECGFEWTFATMAPVFSNNAVVNGPFTPGTKYFPTLGSTGGAMPLVVPYETFISQQGQVTCLVYTNNGSQAWGALRVVCTATRQSVPIQLSPNQLAVPH